MALKQPASLLDQVSCVLGTVIGEKALLVTDMLNSETGSNGEKIEHLKLNIKKLAEFYDVTVPTNLHNVVTYYTLKHIADKSIEVTQNDLNIFDLLLRCHVTKFDFSDWPFEMHGMLHMSLPKLKYLKLLCLDLKHMRNENLDYILEGIGGMKQLESFKCDTYNEDIVKVLCDNCPLINLDYWCFKYFNTDVLIQSILKLQKLETLNIWTVNISKEEQKQLLFGLPHLKTFENRQLNLLLPEICDGNITSLRSVNYYHCSSEDDVTNLIKFCPSIRALNIHIGYNESLDLSDLVNLKYLTSLYVSCDFYQSNIITVLESRGYQITELGIYCNVISVGALHAIDKSCPNLVKFNLNCVSFVDEVEFPANEEVEFPANEEVEFPANEEVEFPTNNGPPFQQLESFSNTVFTSQNNLTPCLVFFLRNCVKIKEVEFITASNFSDADIDDILTCNPLENLEKLFLYRHKLTVQSVYQLLTYCKKLRWLGYVTEWRTITKSDVKELHKYIQRNNLNIEFVTDIYYLSTHAPSVMLKRWQCWSYTSERYCAVHN